MKVENDAIWNDWVKADKVKGFSIEGYFIDKMEVKMHADLMQELTEIVSKT